MPPSQIPLISLKRLVDISSMWLVVEMAPSFPEGDGLFGPQRLGGDRICFDNVWRWGPVGDLRISQKSRGFCWNNSNKKNMAFPGNLEVGEICSKFHRHRFQHDFDYYSYECYQYHCHHSLYDQTHSRSIINHLRFCHFAQDSPKELIFSRRQSTLDLIWSNENLLFRKVDRTTEKVQENSPVN